jgi:hypothetical protein
MQDEALHTEVEIRHSAPEWKLSQAQISEDLQCSEQVWSLDACSWIAIPPDLNIQWSILYNMFIIATSWFRQQKSLVFFSRLIFIGTCIEFIVAKASKRLCFLRVLKRSGVGVNSLIQVFFCMYTAYPWIRMPKRSWKNSKTRLTNNIFRSIVLGSYET